MNRNRGNIFKSAVLLLMSGVLLFVIPASLSVGAQPASNGIYEPADGEVLAGIVIIQGSATHESFLRYELAFKQGASDWIVFAGGEQPVVNGTLAIWDTTVGQPRSPVFPDGTYQLRLRVVHQDYNYDEYYARNLVLANENGTPTPSATATRGEALATVPATPAPASGLEVGRPTKLPTLTPFPTPVPPATPVNAIVSQDRRPGPPAQDDTGGGLFGQLATVDTGRFGAAFWWGARLSIVPFLALAAYVLIRALFRRLWRLFWTRYGSGGGS